MSLPALDAQEQQVVEAVAAHSASLRGGMDALLLKYLWRKAAGSESALMTALAGLVHEGWLEVLGGDASHLRLTTAAYAEWSARAHAAPGAAESAVWTDTVAAAVPLPAARSEMELKHRLGEVLRGLDLPEDGAVTARTLAQIWALLKVRADELRTALDLMARDGQLSLRRAGDTAWITPTADGHRYSLGIAPPAWLLKLAPPMQTRHLKLITADDTQMLSLAAVLLGETELRQVAFAPAYFMQRFATTFRLAGDAALRALELLWRLGHVQAASDSSLRLTPTGLALAAQGQSAAHREAMQMLLDRLERL